MTTLADNPDPSSLAGELRVVLGRLKRRLREQTHLGDLNWSQVSVLGRLERDGPATVTTLAKAEGMRPQSMGAVVSALQAAGLVDGQPDPKDGRQTILSLTPTCREWVLAARAAGEDWLSATIQTRLTPAEQAELTRAIGLLTRLAD